MQWLRHLFGFTRAQTNGFVILLPLLLLVIFSEPLYRNFFLPAPQPPEVTLSGNTVRDVFTEDSLNITWKAPPITKSTKVNPNDASFKDWQDLGVPGAVAARVLAYRKKGGKFFYKTDLLKIYGFDSTLYVRIKNRINLPDKPVADNSYTEPIEKPAQTFDLNLADSARFVRVFGIGPVLAGRIVKYRHLLGGFVAWNQLYQVYGLDTATIAEIQKRFFIDEHFTPRKININVASEQDLAAHPLISRFMARAIISYRLQHGNYGHIDDLRKIVLIKEQDFESVKPYLTID